VYARCSWAVYPKKKERKMSENVIYPEEKLLSRVEEISTDFIRQLKGTVQVFE
jgi:hypothetical protein